MSIRTKLTGDKGIEVAQSYVNMSYYYKAHKMHDKAQTYLLKALNIA